MIKLLFVLAVLLSLIACNDDKENAEYLHLSESFFNLPSSDTILEIKVEANTEWNVISTDDWCSLNKKGDKDNASLIVSISRNKTTDHRESLIIVSAKTISDTLNIIQAQNDSIIIQNKIREVEHSGETLYFSVKSNTDYRISIPEKCKNWIIALPKSRSMTDSRIGLKILPNKEPNTRIADVLIEYGDMSKSDTIRIVQNFYIPVSSIELNYTLLTLEKGKTITLKATCLPENATDTSLNWSSSDNDIISVDNNGLVAIRGDSGTAIITAKSKNEDVEASCTIKIRVPMTSMYFDKRDIEVVFGGEFEITPKFTPSNTTDNRNVYFYVDNPDIISIKDAMWGKFVATKDMNKNNHSTRIVGECEYFIFNDECNVKVVDAIADARLANFIFTDEHKVRFYSSLTYSSYRNVIVLDAKIIDNYGNIRFTYKDPLPSSTPGLLNYRTDYIDVSDIFSHNLEETFLALSKWKFYIRYYFEDENVIKIKEVNTKRQ